MRTNERTGCVNSDTMLVDIEDWPEIEMEGRENVCRIGEIYVYHAPELEDATYNWEATGGDISGPNNEPSVKVRWNNVPEARLTVEVIRQANCEQRITKEIQIFTYVDGEVKLKELEGCTPFTAELAGLDNHNITDIRWNFDGRHVSNRLRPTYSFDEAGEYYIEVIMQNEYGCHDTFNFDITVLQSPVARFYIDPDPNQEKIMDEDFFNMINQSEHADFYTWLINGIDEAYSIDHEPIEHNIDEPGIHWITLEAESSNGCRDTTGMPIRIYAEELMFVPSAFSPDDNGVNDYFEVVHQNIVRFEIAIMNRWGQIIYKSDDIDFSWDGRYQGKKVPEGVYVYYIQAWGFDGNRHHKQGTITVIR